MKTAFELLQLTLTTQGVLQPEGPAPTTLPPDSLRIDMHDTAPASLKTLAETAMQTAVTAFESLADRPVPQSRRTTYWWTNNQQKYETDQQVGS